VTSRGGAAVVALLIATSALGGVDPAECRVQIELKASTFKSSGQAGAQLTGETSGAIYFPTALPIGFQVELASGARIEDPAPPAIASDIKASALWSLDARRYRPEGDLLPIGWKAVGVPNRPSGFSVPAGTYRFKLVYAKVLPREQRGPLVRVCTVYSAAFILATEDSWGEYE